MVSLMQYITVPELQRPPARFSSSVLYHSFPVFLSVSRRPTLSTMRTYILLPLLGLLNMGADAAAIHSFNARHPDPRSNRAMDHRYNAHSHTTRRQVHNADFSGSSSSTNSVVSAPPPSAETSPDSPASGSPSTPAFASAAAANRRAMLADPDPVADAVATVLDDANGDVVDGQAESESGDTDVKKRQDPDPEALSVTDEELLNDRKVSLRSRQFPATFQLTTNAPPAVSAVQQGSPGVATVAAKAPSLGSRSTSTSDTTPGINGSKISKGKGNLLSRGLDLRASAAAKNPSTVLPRASVGLPLPATAPAQLKDGRNMLVSRQAEIDAPSDDVTSDASDTSEPATDVDVVADANPEVEADSADTTDSLLPRASPLDALPVSLPIDPPIHRDIVVDGVSPLDVSASGLSSVPGHLTQRNRATLKTRGGLASAVNAPGVSNVSAAKVRRQSSERAAITAPGISTLRMPNASVATRDIKLDPPFAGGSLSKGSFDPTAMQTQVQRKKRTSTYKSPISTTNLKGSVPATRDA